MSSANIEVIEVSKDYYKVFKGVLAKAYDYVNNLSIEKLSEAYNHLCYVGILREVEENVFCEYRHYYNKADSDEEKITKVEAGIMKEKYLSVLGFMEKSWTGNAEHVTVHHLSNSIIFVHVDEYEKNYFSIIKETKLSKIMQMNVGG